MNRTHLSALLVPFTSLLFAFGPVACSSSTTSSAPQDSGSPQEASPGVDARSPIDSGPPPVDANMGNDTGSAFVDSGADAAMMADSASTDAGTDAAMATDSGTIHTVTVAPNGLLVFDPPSLVINVGDTVHWVWGTSGHTVTSGDNTTCATDNTFCSPNDTNCAAAATSNTGTTYDHVFPAAGTFQYHCSPHCGAGMVATITVQ